MIDPLPLPLLDISLVFNVSSSMHNILTLYNNCYIILITYSQIHKTKIQLTNALDLGKVL